METGTTIIVPTERATELARLGPGIGEQALTYRTIRDVKHRADAMVFVREVKDVRTKIAGLFERITKQAHELHKAIKGQWNDLDKPFEQHEVFVRDSISNYDAEQRRIEEAERRRVAEEARKAELERQRLQAEADAKARREAEDRRLAAAEALAAQGKAAMADAVLAAPIVVEAPKVVAPPVPVYVAPPKAKGETVRWKHRLVDASLVPRQYLVVDDRLLASIATSQKDKASVPGVEFFAESSVRI